MEYSILLFILVTFAVTYAVRVLPFTLIRRPIRNTFVRSFLYYVPYVTLAVMVFPAVIFATGSPISGGIAFVLSAVMAWFGQSLFRVAVSACVAVFVTELILSAL